MSKSLGNIYTVQDVLEKGFNPLALRYLYLQVHYRQEMNFAWEALQGAQTALEKLYSEVATWEEPKDLPAGRQVGCAEYEEKFANAINNDLNMPEALAIVWELVKSDYPTHAKAESLFKMDEILGLDLRVQSSKFKVQSLEIPQEVMALVREREELRKKKRYHLADQLRNKIKKMGYEIRDEEDGTTTVRR